MAGHSSEGWGPDADEAMPGPATRHVIRLVEDDEGARPDTTAEAVAHAVDDEDDNVSAEEAAIHVVGEDEVRGLGSGSDGYLDS